MQISEYDFIAARNISSEIADVMDHLKHRTVIMNHRAVVLPKRLSPKYVVEPEVVVPPSE